MTTVCFLHLKWQTVCYMLYLEKGSFPDKNESLRMKVCLSELDFKAFVLAACLALRLTDLDESAKKSIDSFGYGSSVRASLKKAKVS